MSALLSLNLTATNNLFKTYLQSNYNLSKPEIADIIDSIKRMFPELHSVHLGFTGIPDSRIPMECLQIYLSECTVYDLGLTETYESDLEDSYNICDFSFYRDGSINYTTRNPDYRLYKK